MPGQSSPKGTQFDSPGWRELLTTVLKKWGLACHSHSIRADQMFLFALQHQLC
jgi:hypothetical protein